MAPAREKFVNALDLATLLGSHLSLLPLPDLSSIRYINSNHGCQSCEVCTPSQLWGNNILSDPLGPLTVGCSKGVRRGELSLGTGVSDSSLNIVYFCSLIIAVYELVYLISFTYAFSVSAAAVYVSRMCVQ